MCLCLCLLILVPAQKWKLALSAKMMVSAVRISSSSNMLESEINFSSKCGKRREMNVLCAASPRPSLWAGRVFLMMAYDPNKNTNHFRLMDLNFRLVHYLDCRGKNKRNTFIWEDLQWVESLPPESPWVTAPITVRSASSGIGVLKTIPWTKEQWQSTSHDCWFRFRIGESEREMRILGIYCKKAAKTQNLSREMSRIPNAKSPSLPISNLSRACLWSISPYRSTLLRFVFVFFFVFSIYLYLLFSILQK